jgi:hypothetical protein
MQIRKTKTEVERTYLNGFAKTLKDFPAGCILKSENPDFLISADERPIIGIELTRMFRTPVQGEPPLREQESLREQIKYSAKARYVDLAQPPISVGVLFNNRVVLRRRDVKRVAQMLADVAIRLMPDPGEQRTEKYNSINRNYFPEEVDTIVVGRPERLHRSAWHIASAEDLRPLSMSDIQGRITAKNARVSDYLKKCDRIWLVLCTGGSGLSSYLELSDEASQARYHGQFTRVFIYKWPSTVRELAIQSSEECGI